MPTTSSTDMGLDRITPSDDFGTQLVGRHAGAALRERIVREAMIRPIIVDLVGITSISPSFADELFAKLPAKLVEERRVRFSNATDEIKALARGVRGLRRQLQHA